MNVNEELSNLREGFRWLDSVEAGHAAMDLISQRRKRVAKQRRWRLQLCRELATNDCFKKAVRGLRNKTGATPELRRAQQDKYLSETGCSYHEMATESATVVLEAKRIDVKHESIMVAARKRLEAELGPRLGPLGGLLLTEALLIDFDTDEHELFALFATGFPFVHCWNDESSSNNFPQWLRDSFRPNHVYLDVTLSGLDDVSIYWPVVEKVQRFVGVPEAVRGRLPGELRRQVILRDGRAEFTWSQLRSDLRLHPNLLGRRFNACLAQRTEQEEQRQGTLTTDERRRIRQRASKNFYKQVIYHPQMRDLKLQRRPTGRPRTP